MTAKKVYVSIMLCGILGLTGCSASVPQEDFDALNAEKTQLEATKIELEESLDGKESEITLLNQKYEELDQEYSDYKESMKPYEELSVAEAKAKKIEAEKVAEAEAAEKAAKKKAAAKAAADKKKAAAKKKAEEEAKGYETGISYNQLARTPDKYMGKKVKFYGKVIQVMEGDTSVSIRLAVDDDYDKILLCEYDPSILSSRILEDDMITIYGLSVGTISYESTMGGTITIPGVYVDKIKL